MKKASNLNDTPGSHPSAPQHPPLAKSLSVVVAKVWHFNLPIPAVLGAQRKWRGCWECGSRSLRWRHLRHRPCRNHGAGYGGRRHHGRCPGAADLVRITTLMWKRTLLPGKGHPARSSSTRTDFAKRIKGALYNSFPIRSRTPG